jgi:hypothetical protein
VETFPQAKNTLSTLWKPSRKRAAPLPDGMQYSFPVGENINQYVLTSQILSACEFLYATNYHLYMFSSDCSSAHTLPCLEKKDKKNYYHLRNRM